MELFQLSNLFICPSHSESFGLTVLEAASQGNFLVLNQAVPALQELGEKLGAYFLRWDARNLSLIHIDVYKRQPLHGVGHESMASRRRKIRVCRFSTCVSREKRVY